MEQFTIKNSLCKDIRFYWDLITMQWTQGMRPVIQVSLPTWAAYFFVQKLFDGLLLKLIPGIFYL